MVGALRFERRVFLCDGFTDRVLQPLAYTPILNFGLDEKNPTFSTRAQNAYACTTPHPDRLVSGRGFGPL